MSKTTGRARELGAMLRQRRRKAEWTELQVAKTLQISHGQICRIEQGTRSVSTENVARCLTLYGVFGDEHDEIMALAKEVSDEFRLKPHNGKLPDELCTLIHHETTAAHIDSYEPALVPGLLQTETYARAIFRWTGARDEDGIELRVAARMNRQKLLRSHRRPSLRFFIHEFVLSPRIIDPEIMADQAMALMLACNLPGCEVHIVPADALPSAVFGGPFMFMRYQNYHPIVCVENYTTSEFLEDPTAEEKYSGIVNRLAELALSAQESHERLARMAP